MVYLRKELSQRLKYTCLSNYRIPVHRETLLAESGPRSRSEIAKRIMKTAIAVRGPIVKDCIIMKTLKRPPPQSAVP